MRLGSAEPSTPSPASVWQPSRLALKDLLLQGAMGCQAVDEDRLRLAYGEGFRGLGFRV